MRKAKAFLSFIGKQDPFNRKNKPGPILTLLRNRKFDIVFLLYTKGSGENDMQKPAENTAHEIKNRYSIESTLIPLKVKNPSDFIEIYKVTKNIYCKHIEELKKYELSVSLTSGTPQMHIALFLLVASGEITATMLYQPDPEHSDVVKEIKWGAEIPYIIPQIPKGYPELMLDTKDLIETAKEIGIIGKSPSILRAIKKAQKYAKYKIPVLITGESGTGKELFARLIHKLSDRRNRKFLPFNCAAIPETLAESELFGYKKGSFTDAKTDRDGLFKQADGGTLFLDEIGELSPMIQAKLLRVLEDGTFIPIGAKKEEKVDVRIIAATHRDLEEMVNEGKFREDLYYRIKVLQIELPALRYRKEDIPEIAKYLLKEFCKENKMDKEFTDKALAALKKYEWKGNVRELRTVVWQLAIESDGNVIDIGDINLKMESKEILKNLLPDPYKGFDLNKLIEDIRDYYYEKALQLTNGNQSKTAKLLNVTPQAVNKWIKEHNFV